MIIKERLLVLFLPFMLLCSTMFVLSVLAENDPLTECKCANEPTVCSQYSTDNTCVDRLPNLASPLDEAPDIIAKKYDYYNFGSEWTATYCGGKSKRHVGVDLGVEFEEGKKIPVYAVASGQVKADYRCSSSYDWAKGIVIDHDGAFTTVYEHISPLVSVGQHVDKGQQIATVAKIEGYQHLHFGIKCGGYEAISTRGALPVEHGPCDKKTDCSTSGCRCDPLFPGPFIDPLDARIVYEKHNSPQDIIQSQSPTVQAFQVTPQSLTTGESFTIEYTVSDIEGSGLNRVELWRKDEQSDWQEIKRDALSGGDGPISGSFSDAPSDSSKYWYGIHVADNAGNWNDEKNSNTDNQPGSYGPIEVEVIKVVVQGEESQQESAQEGSTSSSEWQYTGVVDAVQGNYDIAILCFDKAFELDPSFTLALYDKAVILNLQDKYDEAIYVCDKIIELDSRYGRAWNCKGYALLQQGRYDESIQALDKAIEIYPKYADAWHNKGEALQGLNRDTEASDAFAKADDLGYDGPTPIDFGRYWSSVN